MLKKLALGLGLPGAALWLVRQATSDIEPRTALARILVGGTVASALLWLGLLVALGHALGSIIRARRSMGLVTSALLFTLLSGVGFLVSIGWLFLIITGVGGEMRYDQLVYQDTRAPEHKLISQSCAMGFPGCTVYRLIEVWDEHAAFRQYREPAPDSLDGCGLHLTQCFATDSAAPVIRYASRTFLLTTKPDSASSR